MKNRITTITLCAAFISTAAVYTEDKNLSVSATQKKSVSTTDLLASNVKVDANIKVVESFTIMGESEKGQEKRKDIEGKRDLATQDIQSESKKFEKAKNDYVAQSSMMSEDALKKKEKELIKMERDLKNLVAEKEEELKMDMQMATESLAQDLEKAITKLAQNEKIDIVIDKMTGRAIYVSPEFDLTNKAIAEMDKEYKVELAQNNKKAENTKVAENKTAAKSTKANA